MNKTEIFKGITETMFETYKAKNNDYGDSFGTSVKKYGLITALTRISDKFNRLESLILNDTQEVKDESINDTLLDLANYCVMSIIELQFKETISCEECFNYNIGDGIEDKCMIKSYQLQEKEYIEYIEALNKDIKLLIQGQQKLKDEKEEIEKAKQDLGRTLQKKLDYIDKLERQLNNYY